MYVERDEGGGTGSARCRGRRLRSFLRHEGMAVAMAVAEARHHSSRGQTTATAISEVEERELHHAPRRQRPPPPGMRLASLAEPQGTQVVLERHSGIAYELVLALDAPVLQIVDQLFDVLQFFDTVIPVAEQIIKVPRILEDNIPQRTILCEPQLAEQLMKVPAYVSLSFLQ